MRIKQLLKEVQSALRSGTTITDVMQCVIELVHNALDAKATSIAVRLDLEKFSIQVVDNGRGLSKEELDLVGTRYMTNKCQSLKDLKTNVRFYGFRGESLASLRECCGVLMILSRARDSDNTHTKVFRPGRESHSAKRAVTQRLCVGTTVVVRDFLCNLPVRRARIQPAIDMESVRLALVALSLINYQVTFILRNDTTKTVVLQTKEYKDCSEALKHHCSMREDVSLIRVSETKPPFKVFANISRETDQSDQFQFVYVNGRLVKNNDIYKFVRKNLSKSFYLRNIGKEIKLNSCQPRETLHPIFIIRIQCPYIEYEICSDPKKQQVEFRKIHVLLNCLAKLVDKFLSTESDLHLESESKKDNNVCLKEERVNQIDEIPSKSKVMYGVSVKRQGNVDTILPNNIMSPTGNPKFSESCVDLESNKTDVTAESIVASQQIFLEKDRADQSRSRSHSNRSDIKNKSVSDYTVTSDLENPFPFKVPKKFPLKRKIKRLSEHVTTESETDYTPLKRKSTWDSTMCVKEVKPKNSILPIVNYNFFEKALNNLSIARNMIFDNTDNSYKTPKQAIQIDLYRTIKENPKNNSLKFTEEKSISYLFKTKSYMNCDKGITPPILMKHNVLTSISREVVCCSKQINLRVKSLEDKLFYNENEGKLNQQIVSKKEVKEKLNFEINKQKCHLQKNWNIFSPNFKPKVTNRQFKPFSKTSDLTFANQTFKVNRKHLLENVMDNNSIVTTKMNKNISKSNVLLSCEQKNLVESTQKNYDLIQSRKNQSKTIMSLRENTNLKPGKLQNCPKQAYHKVTLKNQFNKKKKSKLSSNICVPRFPEVENKITDLFKNNEQLPDDQNLFYHQNYPGNFRPNFHSVKHVKTPTSINESIAFSNKSHELKKYTRSRAVHKFHTKNISSSQQKKLSIERSNAVFSQKQPLARNVSPECKPHYLSSNLPKQLNLSTMAVPQENLEMNNLMKNQSNEHFLVPLVKPKLTERKFPEMNDVKVYCLDKPFKDGSVTSETFANKQLIADISTTQNELWKSLSVKTRYNGDFERNIKNMEIQDEPKKSVNCLVEHDWIHNHQEDTFPQNNSKNNKYKSNSEIILAINTEMRPNSPFDLKESRASQENRERLLSETDFFEQPKRKEEFINPVLPCIEIDDYMKTNKEILKWNKETLPGGETVYINLMTGMSSYLTPNKETENIYALHDRLWFMPKGISPILQITNNSDVNMTDLTEIERDAVEKVVMENCLTDLKTIKWRSNDGPNKGLCGVTDLLNKRDSAIPWMSKACNKKPCVFSAKSLSSAQVLGQVDSKFIVALMEPNGEKNKFLILFDQHAVDERVRLESLISEYKSSDGDLVSHPLNPHVELPLTDSDRSLATALTLKLSQIGLHLAVEGPRVTATAVPLCIYNRVARERNADSKLMENMLSVLIRQVLLSVEKSRGVVPSMPQLLSDIVNFEACRGAIKFGDKLSVAQCQMLVRKLAQCEVPFQCAHGRPVLTPLLELTPPPPINNKEDVVNLRKLF